MIERIMESNTHGPFVLIPLPSTDFDPTEAGVAWKMLTDNGARVVFATPDGKQAYADPVMVTGQGLGPLALTLPADANGKKAYHQMASDPAFQKPLRYEEIAAQSFEGLVIPGGHASGMRPYLESQLLQSFVGDFIQSGKPCGAICHGVLLAARARSSATGKSVLHERRVTTLPSWMELLAWNLTRAWMGDYYRTYPGTNTQDEVVSHLKDASQFDKGPWSTIRDDFKNLGRGFVVRDGNLVTARWPGDAHLFGRTMVEMLGLGN